MESSQALRNHTHPHLRILHPFLSTLFRTFFSLYKFTLVRGRSAGTRRVPDPYMHFVHCRWRILQVRILGGNRTGHEVELPVIHETI